jgi:hypothetical protein
MQVLRSIFSFSYLNIKNIDRKLIVLGHISIIITAILSLIFYKERVLYVDPGQQLFQMINDGSFIIYNSRFSMAINQAFPLLFIKLGLPLRYIVIAYSMSFVIVYYLCYLIAVYGFKNIPAGLGIAFAPIIIRLAFGHSISEAWLAVVYSAVFYAILSDYARWKNKGPGFLILYYFFIILVIAINYFIHPITLFTLSFSIGFVYFHKKEFRNPHIYIISGIVVLMYAGKFLFPGDPHDESFFVGIKKADQYLPQLLHLPMIKYFLFAFWSTYVYPVFLLILTIVLYIRNRSFIVPIYLVGFCLIYLIIASLAFYVPDAHANVESRFIPMIFFIVVPLIEIIRKGKNGVFIYLLIPVLICSYISLVNLVVKVHTKRINLYKQVLTESEKYPGRKFYIKLPTNKYHAVNTWGSAAETLLLSSMEGKEHSRTILFYDDRFDVLGAPQGIKCLFLWVPWHMYVKEEKVLNKKYFDLQCSQYQELIYPDNF